MQRGAGYNFAKVFEVSRIVFKILKYSPTSMLLQSTVTNSSHTHSAKLVLSRHDVIPEMHVNKYGSDTSTSWKNCSPT